MGRVTVTIHIDYPTEGSVAVVAPPPAAATETPLDEAPWPATSAAPVAAAGTHVPWPAGKCPKHDREWKDGNFGKFCSAKDESGPKGYCALKPGIEWQGRPIPV